MIVDEANDEWDDEQIIIEELMKAKTKEDLDDIRLAITESDFEDCMEIPEIVRDNLFLNLQIKEKQFAETLSS